MQQAMTETKEFIRYIQGPMRELDEQRRKLLGLQAEFTEKTKAL